MKKNFISEISVNYKKTEKLLHSKTIESSKDTADFLISIWGDDLEYKERFYVLFLNRKNTIRGYTLISIGGSCQSIVDIKIIMQHALICHADRIIIAHNHPSGNINPSPEDLKITERINQACKIMDIGLLDHIIISENNYYSFADNARF